jgi:hypothetical protein
MFVCCECCVVVRYKSLGRADHSSRGVLPTMVRRCVWSRNLVNEEGLNLWGGGAVVSKTNKLYQNKTEVTQIKSLKFVSRSKILSLNQMLINYFPFIH